MFYQIAWLKNSDRTLGSQFLFNVASLCLCYVKVLTVYVDCQIQRSYHKNSLLRWWWNNDDADKEEQKEEAVMM